MSDTEIKEKMELLQDFVKLLFRKFQETCSEIKSGQSLDALLIIGGLTTFYLIATQFSLEAAKPTREARFDIIGSLLIWITNDFKKMEKVEEDNND